MLKVSCCRKWDSDFFCLLYKYDERNNLLSPQRNTKTHTTWFEKLWAVRSAPSPAWARVFVVVIVVVNLWHHNDRGPSVAELVRQGANILQKPVGEDYCIGYSFWIWKYFSPHCQFGLFQCWPITATTATVATTKLQPANHKRGTCRKWNKMPCLARAPSSSLRQETDYI